MSRIALAVALAAAASLASAGDGTVPATSPNPPKSSAGAAGSIIAREAQRAGQKLEQAMRDGRVVDGVLKPDLIDEILRDVPAPQRQAVIKLIQQAAMARRDQDATSPAAPPAAAVPGAAPRQPGPVVQILSHQVTREPRDPVWRELRGVHRVYEGDYRGGFADLDAVIQRGPPNPRVLTAYSEAAYHLQDFKLARDASALVLKLEPGNKAAFAINKLSDGRASAVNLPSALGAAGGGTFETAAAAPAAAASPAAGYAAPAAFVGAGPSAAPAAPQGPSQVAQSAAMTDNARLALTVKDYALAALHASKAIELNPENAQALNYRAIAYNRMHRYPDAVADASAALGLAPNNSAALQTRSWAFAQQKQYREALHDAEATLSADPRNPFAYQNKAFALAGLGDRDGALDALRLSAALDARFKGQYERALQLPKDQDLTLLFDDGTAASAASAAPPRPVSTPRRFARMALLSGTGGLLIALGILHVVSASWREKVRMTVRRVLAPADAAGGAAAAATPAPSSSAFWTQYDLVKEIGMGGMGVVYEAKDRSLERRVAVKKMRDEIRIDPHERQRFVNEAKVVASLRHPNIVDIYAIVEDGADVYLVFEFVEGRTLHDRLRSEGAFSFGEGLKAFRAICGAVEHAHAGKVIHRDLKPSNVMVTTDGRIKVMDFGVARQAKDALTKMSMTNTVVGTPPYMAPEQEQGTVRKESDVYALGVCFYEMLTGQLPFAGAGSGMLLNKINGKHIPPTQRVPSLPAGLDAVMARALHPDPDKRYHTPGELLADLERLA